MKNAIPNRILRVAFPAHQAVTKYEPTDIKSAYEYIFLENIFSPLIEISVNGSIDSGVSERADWIGDELRLTIRKNLRTATGTKIVPEDVVFSLKRLLVLTGNTHGNFGDIVCPGAKLKNVEDVCPGIRAEGDYVFLNAKGKKSFLLPMLGAIDFAIIPKASVDPATLKITNYKETSGPYYVASDDGRGNIRLILNTNHYFAAEDIPQEIVLVPTDPKVKGDSLNALKNGVVDHLTTVDMARADELLPFSENNPEYERHMTLKIRSLILVFTERGKKDLSPSERRFIGEKLKSAFSKIYAGMPGFESRSEFFPSLGDGGLTSDQQKRLTEINKQNTIAPKKFKLGLMRAAKLEDWSDTINQELPQAECIRELVAPDLQKNLKEVDTPQAYVTWTDTGFTEDISLISYSLNAGQLGLPKSERARWLADYMAIDDKPLRIQKLKELHFHALAEPSIIPLMASPYAALVRKPWKMELSDLYANNQLWRIKLR